MKRTPAALLAVAMALNACTAWGHGFGLSLSFDAHGNPTKINVSSQEAFLDLSNVTPGANNLFLNEFSGTPESDASGTYYSVIHGFAQTSGPWPPYTATFNVITPLYFSGGGNTASLAPGGTYIDTFDLWAGNPQPNTNPHPGASFGDVFINGQTSFDSGFGVSLYDAHELEKDLYIGSGPTYGEFGFAFDITVHFTNGPTLTTGPLVDVFAMSDPNAGGFASNASVSQQDAATRAIYSAGMADVNFDGVVNGLDIALIASHWLQTGTIDQLAGDANRDGVVNGLDIAAVASFWEASGGGAGTGGAAVPEPMGVTLALCAAGIACVCLAAQRNSKRRRRRQ